MVTKLHTYIATVSLGVCVLVGLFGGLPHTADAMVVRAGETYTLDTYATLEDDLYVAGKSVAISGTTTGDVYAVGSYVEETGVVSQDLFVAGGNVKVTGEVKGDLRILGGKVYVSGHVTEDLFVAGGTVIIEDTARIDGDIFVFGDYLELKGAVSGLAELHVRLAEITGTIEKNVRLTAEEAVSIKGNAQVKGDFSYEAPRSAFISDTASIQGATDFKQREQGTTKAESDAYGLMAFLVLTVISAVTLVYFFPTLSHELVTRSLNDKTGITLLRGLALFIAWPVLSLLVMITVVGVVPGFVLLLAYGLVFTVSLMLAPVLSGVLLAQWLKKGELALRPAWASLGAIVFTAIAFLPFLGFILRALLFILSFSAISSLIVDSLWKKRKEGMETKPAKKQETHENTGTEGE